MQAHQRVAAFPIDLECERLPDLGLRHTWRREMTHAVDRIALARIQDLNTLAVGAQQRTRVARLTAAQWIEDRAVELDAKFMHRKDARARCLQVSIVAEQQRRDHGISEGYSGMQMLAPSLLEIQKNHQRICAQLRDRCEFPERTSPFATRTWETRARQWCRGEVLATPVLTFRLD